MSAARGSEFFTEVIDVLRARMVRPIVMALPSSVTPNALSWTRLALAGLLALLLARGSLFSAALVYGLAAASDALDGELARARQQVSKFGARLDPAVDKVLHGVFFIYFLPEAPLSLGLILALDVLLFVAGSFLVLLARGSTVVISASTFGRWKMIFQSFALFALLANALLPFRLPALIPGGLIAGALLFGVLSLIGYLPRVVAHGTRAM